MVWLPGHNHAGTVQLSQEPAIIQIFTQIRSKILHSAHVNVLPLHRDCARIPMICVQAYDFRNSYSVE